jgi:AMP phosphorylase
MHRLNFVYKREVEQLKLKIKRLDWSTGNAIVGILNTKDAGKLNTHRGDRILVKKKKNCIIATVDESLSYIKEGEIGLNYEAVSALKGKNKSEVEVEASTAPDAVNYIREKLNGERLSKKKIQAIIEGIVDNSLSTIEITYFVASSYVNGLSLDETAFLTEAMYQTGDILRFNAKKVVDKHCIGGVAGNRTTPIIVAIAAAAGLTIPKSSSRSITSPAGTADVLEVLCNVEISKNDILRIVNQTKGCMIWGGTVSLAPADDEIIRIEHPMNIDSLEQMVASVLAKKKSVSGNIVLIDIPIGRYAKIKNRKEGERLKRLFNSISKRIGLETEVVFTKALGPIGRGIGPALEARDVLRIFEGHPEAPRDLREKGLRLAGRLLELAKKVKKGEGYKEAKKLMQDGRANRKFWEILKAQGAKVSNSSDILIGKFRTRFRAEKDGKIRLIRNDLIAQAAKIAGAPKDKKAGIYLKKLRMEKVRKNQVVFELYAESRKKLQKAIKYIKQNNPYIIK